MKYICTRVKRSLRICTHRKHSCLNKTKKHGEKTFSTKENAEKHAKEVLKLKEYSIAPAKKDKRFKIVKKQK
ncbi:MAG: hypothetical protein V1659_00975 [Candidatus Woesearchaeota archaeon]